MTFSILTVLNTSAFASDKTFVSFHKTYEGARNLDNEL